VNNTPTIGQKADQLAQLYTRLYSVVTANIFILSLNALFWNAHHIPNKRITPYPKIQIVYNPRNTRERQSMSPVNNKSQYSKEFKKEAVDLALSGSISKSKQQKI